MGAHPSDSHRHELSRHREARALRWALGITTVLMVAEFLGGLWTNSLALLADAGHMLTDAAALALSLFAVWFIQRPSSPEKTYGYFRVEILAALFNGAALIGISVAILLEAYERFQNPEVVRSGEMLVIAVIGLVANLICAKMLHAGHNHDNLNLRGAFLHVVGDALGSVGAITAGVAMLLWQAYWADPLVSLLVAGLISWNAVRLVLDSVRVLLEGAPSHINVPALMKALESVQGVDSVHDLHVWTLTSGLHAMTCHAVVERRYELRILEEMNRVCRESFGIQHTTIQIEEEDLCCENGDCLGAISGGWTTRNTTPVADLK